MLYRSIFPCLLNICEILNVLFSKQYLDTIGPISHTSSHIMYSLDVCVSYSTYEINSLRVFHCFPSKYKGGHSHRRRVQNCDRGQDAVKWSRYFLGVGQTVKQCAGHYLRHYWRSRGVADPFAHAQLIDGQGSRAKSGVVKRSRPFFDGQKS